MKKEFVLSDFSGRERVFFFELSKKPRTALELAPYLTPSTRKTLVKSGILLESTGSTGIKQYTLRDGFLDG